ncbi:MAG TPA: DUF4192 domain-containing protein [Pseudonocardiaceae bacterium]|nr:DUF4192 domain-containing protein [Pseudonocardiaceae bacterium]
MDDYTVVLKSSTDLLYAVPTLLGFYPRDSLVTIGLDRGERSWRVRFAARTDLPGSAGATGAGRAPTAVELAGYLAGHATTTAVLLVIGGANNGGHPSPTADLPHQKYLAELRAACAASGIALGASLWVARIAEGQRWYCYEHPELSGHLSDPTSTPLAATAVAAGQVTYAERGELEHLVAEADPHLSRRRRALLDARIADATHTNTPVTGGQALALIEQWIQQAGTSAPRLAEADIIELCLAVRDAAVRDVCFGFALDEQRAGAAQRLWSALITQAPAPISAEIAALLAVSAPLAGNGALAGMALRRAQHSCPGHQLSDLLLQALGNGVTPAQIRQWVAHGAAAARAALNTHAGT